MTEIQAAIGLIQLDRLDHWIFLRNRNALILYHYLKDISSIRVPIPENDIKCAWYKFYVFLKPNSLKQNWDRNKIIKRLEEKKFPAFMDLVQKFILKRA